MYQSIQIKNFRCFEDLQVENLGQVNLIVGRNNAGKSALLEALYLLGNYPFPERVARLSPWRGLDETDWFHRTHSAPPWSYWFAGYGTQTQIRIGAATSNDGTFSVTFQHGREFTSHSEILYGTDEGEMQSFSLPQTTRLEVPTQVALRLDVERRGSRYHLCTFVYDSATSRVALETDHRVRDLKTLRTEYLPSFRGANSAESLRRFSEITEQKQQSRVVSALARLEPNVQDIRLVFSKELPLIMCDTGGEKMIPLALMGDGMLQMFHLSALIATAQNGVALIDEIENGLHYSVYPALWEVVAETAQAANAQVFATTHSYECIQAAVEVFAKRDPNLLRVHRLERSKGVIRAITYDPDVLETAIEKFFEVR